MFQRTWFYLRPAVLLGGPVQDGLIMATSSCVPVSTDPQVAALQERAERTVRPMAGKKVVKFELNRLKSRKELGLTTPVPVTTRGRKHLTAAGYTVSDEGYLVLG